MKSLDRWLVRGNAIADGRLITGYLTIVITDDGDDEYDCFIQPEADFSETKELVSTHSVMQCTGLKDKNGTLIFEGDRLTTPLGSGRVKWGQLDNYEDWAGWWVREIDRSFALTAQRATYLEVIKDDA